MNRRAFIKGLLSLPALLILPRIPKPIKTSFKLIGTSTGRLSCRHPSFQQQTWKSGPAGREFEKLRRHALMYGTGTSEFIQLDLYKQELRVISHLTKEKTFYA